MSRPKVLYGWLIQYLWDTNRSPLRFRTWAFTAATPRLPPPRAVRLPSRFCYRQRWWRPMEKCGKPPCPEAMTGNADDQDPLMQHESPVCPALIFFIYLSVPISGGFLKSFSYLCICNAFRPVSNKYGLHNMQEAMSIPYYIL